MTVVDNKSSTAESEVISSIIRRKTYREITSRFGLQTFHNRYSAREEYFITLYIGYMYYGNAFNNAKFYVVEYHSLEMKYLHKLFILHKNKFSTTVALSSFFSNLAKCYLHPLRRICLLFNITML